MNFDLNSTDHAFYTSKAMIERGGSFAQHIGRALQVADMTNRRAIVQAFPDLIERYGPGSWHYSDALPRGYTPPKPRHSLVVKNWPADFDGAHSLTERRSHMLGMLGDGS